MLVEVRLRPTAIQRTPDMFKTNKHRPTDLRVRDERHVERRCLFAGNQRIAHVIPAEWISPLKVHVSAWTEVRVHTNVRVQRIDKRLPAIAATRLEPRTRFRAVGPRAVIL